MTLQERHNLVEGYLGKLVRIEIDRPIGYVHHKENTDRVLVYPINYGYIPNVLGGDGEELDVYLYGVDTPVTEFFGRIVGIVYRHNDVEDKLIMAPDGITPTAKEIASAIHFQEQYYQTVVKALPQEKTET